MKNTPVIYKFQQDNVNYDISFSIEKGHHMINATEMIKAFPNKKMNNFLRNEQTESFVKLLESKTLKSVLIVNHGGSNPGTWMHEKLALKFASWLSPEFELWVYDRIEELLKLGVTYLKTTEFNSLTDHMFQQVQRNNSKAIGRKNYGIEKDSNKIIKYFREMFEAYVGMPPCRLISWAKKQGIPLSVTNKGGRETLRYLNPAQASVISFIDNAIASNPELTMADMYQLIQIGRELEPQFKKMTAMGIGDSNDLKYIDKINEIKKLKKIMKNNIVVVFSSHLSEEENQKFITHVDQTIGAKHKTVCYPNFGEFSLAQVYNDALKTHSTPDCVFVFCHNDMIYKTRNWGKILLNQMNHNDFGIVGVAGTTYVPKSGMWWEDRSKMYGIVEHTDGLKTWVSEYSNPINGIQPTVMVDGLFMAVDPEKIVKGFNENYGKFHFYDITFCVDNYNEEVNVGVTTSIRVLHKSVGMTNQSWEDNRKKFSEEYNLPIRHFQEKLRVLICCQFFKNYTGSEVSNYELSSALVKLGCDVTLISSVVGDPLQRKALVNGVRVYSFANLPNYVLDQQGQFHFTKNEREFDIIHINHKPIGELMLGLYPNTPAVMHVRSEVIPVFEEPIVNSQIKKYISIRESITEYIKTFDIKEDNIVEIANPFDTSRFNTAYTPLKNPKEVVLFIGTLDHLRKNILLDLIKTTGENNQELWIIGMNNGGYKLANDMSDIPHVKYLGVKSDVEKYLKQCDFTAGIFKGRTTIEGYLCGKPAIIYTVDNQGNILGKELKQVPDDLSMYDSEYSAEKVLELYDEVIDTELFQVSLKKYM